MVWPTRKIGSHPKKKTMGGVARHQKPWDFNNINWDFGKKNQGVQPRQCGETNQPTLRCRPGMRSLLGDETHRTDHWSNLKIAVFDSPKIQQLPPPGWKLAIFLNENEKKNGELRKKWWDRGTLNLPTQLLSLGIPTSTSAVATALEGSGAAWRTRRVRQRLLEIILWRFIDVFKEKPMGLWVI